MVGERLTCKALQAGFHPHWAGVVGLNCPLAFLPTPLISATKYLQMLKKEVTNGMPEPCLFKASVLLLPTTPHTSLLA